MEKNEILSNLYAIRAGLSAIAIEKDPLDVSQKEVDSLDKKIESNQETVQMCKNTIPNEERYIKRYQDEINSKKVKSSDFVSMILEHLGVAGIVAGIAAGVGLVAAIVIWSIKGAIGELTVGDVLMFAVPAALIAFVITYIVVYSNTIKPKKNAAENARASCESRINRSQANIIDCNQKIKTLDEENKNLKVKRQNVAEKHNNDAKVIVSTIKAMYDAMEEKYGLFLDPRDWENLDLLIYYISTGRADTIKEALQQVDHLKQTAMIVNALGEATKTICKSIEHNISALRKDLDAHFSSLSQQLHAQHVAQMKSFSSLSSSINSIGGKLDAANANAALQTALLKKIDQSSQSLANTAAKISQYGVRAL